MVTYPIDWKCLSLEDICIPKGLVRGPFGGSLKKNMFVKRGNKVYEQRNAIYKTIDLGKYYITNEKYNELSRFAVNSGDFIVSCSGTIGRIYKIPENYPKGIINQALLKISIDEHVCSSDYFYYYFEWEKFQEKIIDNTQGGAMKNLVSMDIFRKTLINIPEKSKEQITIASILSDFDEHIDNLSELIEKKRFIRDGALEDLMSGRTRLEGFDEEWGSDILQNLCYLVTKQTGFDYSAEIKPSLVTNKKQGVLPFIQNKDFEKLSINYETDFYIPLKVAKKYPKILLEEVCLLISISGRIGNVAVFDYKQPSFAGGAVGIAKLKDPTISEWCMYYLVSENGQKQIFRHEKVGAQRNLTVEDVRNLNIKIPPKTERDAIVKILKNMDENIKELEMEKEKIMNIREGATDNLLTGQVRLKVFEEEV